MHKKINIVKKIITKYSMSDPILSVKNLNTK